ncbi:MAG: DUF2842 domain-containing protein [Pseudomonadota bacterium]
MSPRLKKLIAMIVLLPSITVYFFAAAALGERVPAITILQVFYYIIAGIAWALPVRYLIMWANAEPAPKQDGG